MRTQNVDVDIVVIGGGLAGLAAAIAAARMGRTVALINNRPVLGGNSSSEVRVWVCGATAHGNQRWARETGIMGELYLENQYRNPDGNPIYWDDVVLDAVRREPNIRLFLNTDVREVEASGPNDARRIDSVSAWTMGAETLTTFRAPIFMDCTGDGLVGHLAGASYRLGKEARSEFNEDWAPEQSVREFLGSTLLFYTKDVRHPVKFVAPDSARDITTTPIPATRVIRSGDSGAAYWWIEWGGELDIVDDNERIRDELRSVVLGVWDYIKNSGQFDADTLTLEWIGNLPGKREYRRFIGDHTLTQNDVIEQRSFEDAVAFGGWSIDLHPAEGMYAPSAGAVQRFPDGVFEIPYRCLYSVNVENMLMAGRNISATHIALGATRVMATCASLGEAAGTAAALCVEHRCTPRDVYREHLFELRQTLLRHDASVLGVANEDPNDLARIARVTASSTMTSVGVVGFGGDDGLGGNVPPEPYPLVRDLGIVVPVDPELTSVDLWVSAERDTQLDVELWSTGMPQNVVPETREVVDAVAVSAGPARWVTATLPYAPAEPCNAVVVLRANPDVAVHVTRPLPPGVLTLVHGADSDDTNVEVHGDQLLMQWPTKPLRGSSLVFRAAPGTQAFAPTQVVGGYNRPFGGPNMWVSGPLASGAANLHDEAVSPKGAWLRLDWDEPVQAREVVVVFDDDVDLELNTLHHHRSPDEIIPQLVRDYAVEVLVDEAGGAHHGGAASGLLDTGRDECEQWTTVASVEGNRMRRRAHTLDPDAAIKALRLRVLTTNGVAEARVVALRVQR